MAQGVTIKGKTADGQSVSILVDADGRLSVITNAVAGLTDEELRAAPVVVDADFPADFPLPAAQVATLTPPAPITGFATETTLSGIEADTDFRFGGGKLPFCTTVSNAGDNVLITPAAGKRIRLFWVGLVPNSDNANANLFRLGFGTSSIATELYRGYAMAHWEVFTGTANQSVIINTATAEPIAVTIHYQEIA